MAYSALKMLMAFLIVAASRFDDVSADDGCPENWTRFQESCYVFVDDLVTWPAAKTICLSLLSNLVEIESEEENTFVAQLLRSKKGASAWIGLDDFVQEGRWVVSSVQELAPFLNWDAGEPNNDYNQDCGVLMDSGKWDDNICSSQDHLKNFICESRVAEEPLVG